MVETDNTTILDAIKASFRSRDSNSQEFKDKVTEATNNIRKLIPELKEAAQNTIIDHIQASNRPVDGNGQFISNFVPIDDIYTSLLIPNQIRIQSKWCNTNNFSFLM